MSFTCLILKILECTHQQTELRLFGFGKNIHQGCDASLREVVELSGARRTSCILCCWRQKGLLMAGMSSVKEGFSLYIEKVLILVHQLEEYFMRVCALNY